MPDEAQRLHQRLGATLPLLDWHDSEHNAMALYSRQKSLFRLLYTDLEVALLNLADHMSLLELWQQPEDRSLVTLLSRESRAIVVPILRRLGAQNWRCRVYNTALQYDPHYTKVLADYHDFISEDGWYQKRVREIVDRTREAINRAGITAHVEQRDLHLHSFYEQHQELRHQQRNTFIVQVMVHPETEADCYKILKVVHQLGEPIRIDDLIARPGNNGYRTLKTLVRYCRADDDSYQVRYHIETDAMYKFNSEGYFAHERANEASAWWNDVGYMNHWLPRIEAAETDGKITVFTPAAIPIQLPSRATVLDFAYRIHSEVGNTCDGIRVGQQPVRLDHRPEPGDVIQVITNPSAPGPTEAWLKLAKTPTAQRYIRAYLNHHQLRGERGQTHFRQILDLVTQDFGLNISSKEVEAAIEEWVSRSAAYHSVNEYMHAVAVGSENPTKLIRRIINDKVSGWIVQQDGTKLPERISVAMCCIPNPNNEIVGVPRRARRHSAMYYSVHRADCPTIDPTTALPLKWVDFSPRDQIAVQIDAWDRERLAHDILEVAHKNGFFVRQFNARVLLGGGARIDMLLEIEQHTTLDNLEEQFAKVDRVKHVHLRYLTQRETEIRNRNLMTANPYTPQPIQDAIMFFGRERELAELAHFLSSPAQRSALITGQRRVGKTSTLLKLQRDNRSAESPWLPVLITLQADSRVLEKLVGQIIEAVKGALEQYSPQISAQVYPGDSLPQRLQQDPASALIRWLRHVTEALGERKLLLLFDEGDRLFAKPGSDAHGADVFDFLRDVSQAPQVDLKQIHVINEYYLRCPPQNRPEFTKFLTSSSRTIRIGALETAPAQDLIQVPMADQITFSPGAVDYFREQVSNQPYYIHRLADALVNHLARPEQPQNGEIIVTRSDIDTVIDTFANDHEGGSMTFAHVFELRSDMEKQLLDLMIAALEGDATQSVAEADLLNTLSPEMQTAARRSLSNLVAADILGRAAPGGSLAYHFQTPLFARWRYRQLFPLELGKVPQ
ncbi:MAG: TGS domain-containing protein [Chloroflexi bacterium]|nr:TGS domain-containing protein [Chloroflexota bacterium]